MHRKFSYWQQACCIWHLCHQIYLHPYPMSTVLQLKCLQSIAESLTSWLLCLFLFREISDTLEAQASLSEHRIAEVTSTEEESGSDPAEPEIYNAISKELYSHIFRDGGLRQCPNIQVSLQTQPNTHWVLRQANLSCYSALLADTFKCVCVPKFNKSVLQGFWHGIHYETLPCWLAKPASTAFAHCLVQDFARWIHSHADIKAA